MQPRKARAHSDPAARCPSCGARLQHARPPASKTIRCGACGHRFRPGVPGPPQADGNDEFNLVAKVVDGWHVDAPFRADCASVIYRASDAEGRNFLALRVLKPASQPSSVSLDRLQKRVETISGLDSPGLVAFKGRPVWLDVHVALKEAFEPAVSIHRKVVQKRLAKLGQIVDVIAACVKAVAPLHEARLSHGMLSWRNLFLDSRRCVKVADAATLCALRLVTGGVWRRALDFLEPGFLAPEVIDTGTSAPTSDIYSLGVIFYLGLTGRQPYEADTPAGIRELQRSREYPRPSDLNPGVPEGVVACIARMLNQNPLQRYESLDDLSADLDYLRKRRVVVNPPQADYGGKARVKRAARPLGKDPLLNKVLGNCEVLARVGEGAMGVVYKARHLGLDRHVAIKVLAPHLTSNARYVKRFRREAMTVAQLENENIVQIYNVGHEKGYHFIEIQFIEGEDLGTYLRREKVVKLQNAMRIVEQVARGLRAAHKHGVVHRDIKPENIMLTRRGEVRISDFGLAESFTQSDRAKSRRPAGTPYYMSPEQCRAEPVDGRSDIYSLGVTFYYMLAGERPYEGPTPAEVMRKHQFEYAKPLREVKSTLPEEVCAVVERMMNKDPQRRYPSCDELLADLDGLLERRREKAPEVEETTVCPHCGGPIRKAAVKCRHCKKIIADPVQEAKYKKCPYCGSRIKAEAKSCLKCGVMFRGLDRLTSQQGGSSSALSKCPYCGEEIHPSALVCPYCAETVPFEKRNGR